MEVSLRRAQEMSSRIRREGTSFSDLESRIENLFDRVFGASLVSYVMPETKGMFSPRMDIKETKKDFKIVSEMPGMDLSDIEVTVRDGMLTIKGEKKVEKEEKETDYHHVERSYGCFSRSVSLPGTVDIDKIESAYKNGVLTVRVPKTGKSIEQSRKIPVNPA